jgi:hypothetical protein
MEIGDRVRVKADGSEGTVMILDGSPPREAYVDIEPGASAGYVYMRIIVESWKPPRGPVFKPETLALNPYTIDELEVV